MIDTEARSDYDSLVARYRDTEAMVAFGRALRVARARKGLSQTELARQAVPPIERSRLGAIERGERDPGLTLIVRLAQALGMTPGRLLDAMGEEAER